MSGYFKLNSQKALDKLLQQRGVVLVDFEADWCHPCKMIKPYLLKRCQETESDLVMVNVDAGEELVDQFKVTEIPCLMIL
jgi:thioredoxin 1